MRYHHVDVFALHPYTGNSLAVFPDATGLDAEQMSRITKELRHFESIFLIGPRGRNEYDARVFDLFEELDFAGHPVIGAAAVLHAVHGTDRDEEWAIRLPARTVVVRTTRRGPGIFAATLDQGRAQFFGAPTGLDRTEIGRWFALDANDFDAELVPEVVSTGLRYLVVPVRPGALARARVAVPDLGERLASVGAQFAYLVAASAGCSATLTESTTATGTWEGRHWNNDGVVEDVATGSAAGCVGAYLRRYGRVANGAAVVLKQGRFVGRPSEMTVRAFGDGVDIESVEVGGDVTIVGDGRLDALPGSWQ